MATLYWAVCDICNFTGLPYEDVRQANEELSEHMRRHAAKGEEGGGRLEQSE
jgi:hypothetical protein